jgi:hypothetical protein
MSKVLGTIWHQSDIFNNNYCLLTLVTEEFHNPPSLSHKLFFSFSSFEVASIFFCEVAYWLDLYFKCGKVRDLDFELQSLQ